MISIRGGSGLGDALYLQSIARHFVQQGQDVEACCNWPDVFRPLGGKVKVTPFRRHNVDRLAHYSRRRDVPGTTQFEDCCREAGVSGKVDLRLDWTLMNAALVAQLCSVGKPIVVVQMPRAPFARTDGYGVEFLPDVGAIQHAIDALAGRAFIVQIGKGEPKRFDGKRLVSFEGYRGIDLDLANKTSVADVLDIGCIAQAFVGYPSFLIPLAESFLKPVLLVWSRAGTKSQHQVVRQMTPQKLLHRPSSLWMYDDCSQDVLIEGVNALCREMGSKIAA